MESEPEVIINILRSTDSQTNHESAVNRCRVAADEIERLYKLVGEMLPFMVEDSQDGVTVGERSSGDTCKPDCPDCVWYEQSVGWQARIAAGEFADWGLHAHVDEARVQSAAVAASPHEVDDQSFVDALSSDDATVERELESAGDVVPLAVETVDEIDALQSQLAKLEQKCARLVNALNWYVRKNPDTAEEVEQAIAESDS